MSSVALYRKYRPLKFSDVIGQGHIVQTLSNAIKNDRISHAYLFTGPRGTGKTTLARLIAREMDAEFYELNASTTGIKELKEKDLIEHRGSKKTGGYFIKSGASIDG